MFEIVVGRWSFVVRRWSLAFGRRSLVVGRQALHPGEQQVPRLRGMIRFALHFASLGMTN
jgi:hypothetical protein